MALLKVFQTVFYSLIALLSVFITFLSVVDLMGFLSYPNWSTFKNEESHGISITWKLLVNMSLLTGFIFLHSYMALPSVKNFYTKLNIAVLERSIYVLCSSLYLKLLISYWQPIYALTLWEFNVNKSIIFWLFLLPHVMSWTVIYVGVILMDVNELLGLKQVYYFTKNLPSPLSFKSRDLKQLYSHMRHPSFIGFLVIFWLIPIMSLDRFLLATILSCYMYIAWNTSQIDYRYQRTQFFKKFHELEHLN